MSTIKRQGVSSSLSMWQPGHKLHDFFYKIVMINGQWTHKFLMDKLDWWVDEMGNKKCGVSWLRVLYWRCKTILCIWVFMLWTQIVSKWFWVIYPYLVRRIFSLELRVLIFRFYGCIHVHLLKHIIKNWVRLRTLRKLEPICDALDWVVTWIGMMGLKKVVIFVC